MATLEKLLDDKVLFLVTVPLGRGQFHDRKLYAFRDCLEWMRATVPQMVTGRIQSASTPKEQMIERLRQWMAGEQMEQIRMFREMTPLGQDVIEMKTDDLWIFGWLYKPGTFVAVRGGYADDYKEPTKTKNYADDMQAVVAVRDALPLDGGKIYRGDFNDLYRT